MSDYSTYRLENRGWKPDFDPNSAWNQPTRPMFASSKTAKYDSRYAVAIRHQSEDHWRPHALCRDFQTAFNAATNMMHNDIGFFAVIWCD